MKTLCAARPFRALHVQLLLLILTGLGGPLAASNVTLDGAAMLDEALVEASVSVEAKDGTVLVGDAGRTNWAGRFTVEVPANAAGYRVVATGGHTSRGDFGGTLAAQLDAAAAARFVVLEPITTLVDGYLRAEPSATLQDAQARVGSFLAVPADPGIEAVAWDDALAVPSPYFDRTLFVDQAAAAGGFDAYVAALVQRMRAGAVEPFVQPPKRALLRGAGNPISDLAKDVAGKLGGMALDALLEKTGLLDKLGLAPEKVNVATKEQVEELARSVEAVRADLRRVSEQITRSTEPIANQIGELREFTAFTTRNGPGGASSISDHLTVFETVRGDYAAFVTGGETSIRPNSLIAEAINTKILGAGTDFRDRVNSIHSNIVATNDVGGLVDGVYTLLAKVARENGKDWSVVENYFLKLTGWQTQAIGLYLDAKRYKGAPQGDIDSVKANFRQQMAAQRLELLRAAEVYVLHKGPRGLTGVPATDLAPMARADLIVHSLEGKKGWVTAAVLGFSDPVVAGLASYAGPYMQVDAASSQHQFDATLGTTGNSYYRRNVEYPLAGPNCYYYIGRDFAERNSPGYFGKLAAGLGCKARVMRYRASLEPPPFLTRFAIASSAIEDADAAARRTGQRPGDQAPPFGTLTFSKVDLVTGAESTFSSVEQISLAGSVNATASGTSQFTLAGETREATLIYIPGNALIAQGMFLAPKCEGGTVRFGFGAAAPEQAFPFRQVNRVTTPCTGNCAAPEVAFGFKCPGSNQEQFMAPPATEGGLATASAQPFYFKLATGVPRHRTRLTYNQGGQTAALYLNIPTSIGFYGGLVGYDVVGKSRDVGAFRDGTRLQTGGGLLDKEGWLAINDASPGEKELTVRILGARALDFDLSATGELAGTLVRRADYEGTCNTLKPSLTGSFSADEAVFATKTLLAPGSCRGLSETPVRETFTGTGAVRAKAAGSTLSVKMRAETRLSYDGKHSPELIRMSADGNLSATKLEVTIANPGNF